ncbi:MAG: hypothetical protein AB7N71_13650, partial [Phycisphaerae bacterium]
AARPRLSRNHYHGNTSGNYNNADNAFGLVESATSGDPLFTDAAGFDYRPGIGSPVLRRAGGIALDFAGAYLPHIEPIRRKLVRR